MTDWLEVALVVNGEMAEAVADVLAAFAFQGVAIESTAIAADAYDRGGAIGPLKVRAFVPLTESEAATRTMIEKALWPLGMIAESAGLPRPEPTFTTVNDADWANQWKQHYHPVRIGKRLMIVPAWLNPALEPGDVEVRIEPGNAFGTGTHPTTQLCLEVLESQIKGGERVLDLGCGSGILAIAAIKLGAAHVWGYDIDPLAVEASQQNAADNAVAEHLTVGQGSLGEATANGPYSVVVANILSRIIIDLLAQGLAQQVAPGGLLVLSGIIDTQADEVEAAVLAQGLKVVGRWQQTDWVALVYQAPLT